MTLSPYLRRTLRLNIALALLCVGCEFVARYLLRLKYPYGLPFLPGWGQDFRAWVFMFRHIHTSAFLTTGPYPFLYPPAAAPFLWIFSVSPWHPAVLFYAAALLVVLVTVTLFTRALIRTGASASSATAFTLLLALVSFPLWFELRCGNIEISSLPCSPSRSGLFCMTI